MSEDSDHIVKALRMDGDIWHEFADVAGQTLIEPDRLLHVLFVMVQRHELYFLDREPLNELRFRLPFELPIPMPPGGGFPRTFRFSNGELHAFNCPRNNRDYVPSAGAACCAARAEQVATETLPPERQTPRSFRFLDGNPHDFDCVRLLPENRQGNTTICCKAEADRQKAAGG